MKIVNTELRAASQNKLDDSMIPAINIVFLLLIFFMIAGHIEARNEHLQVPASYSETQLEAGQFEIKIDANRVYYINGKAVDTNLSEQLKGMAPLSADIAVVCHVHRDLPATVLDPVLIAVRELGIRQLSIATVSQQ
jgi:biopolymer transport protein ExbD